MKSEYGPGPGGTLPRISVILPVYNVAGFVGECIRSLRAQSFEDFEVIIVDDGSTDDSAEIAFRATGGDRRFRLVSRANGGLSAARNLGLDLARGEVIGFVDSDDRVAPDYLAALHATLLETGADWAACAVRYVRPDGGGQTHSAMHGRPFREVSGNTPVVYRFDDWTDVIPHFPSAWNKLYRRDLVQDLRFIEGRYFEDHSYFHAAAKRTGSIAYLGRPLYFQTIGRPGQITRDDSDRVFDMIGTLEHLAAIMLEGPRPGGREALSRIASRLVYERSRIIALPDRRTRFAQAGRSFFERYGLRFSTEWDPGISPLWGVMLDGRPPLSIVIPTATGDGPLRETLASIAAQELRDVEILLVQDGRDPPLSDALKAIAGDIANCRAIGPSAPGLAAARNRGIDAASGEFILFMQPGEVLVGDGALQARLERMVRNGSDIGLTALRIAGAAGGFHSGFHDAPDREGEHADLVLTPETALQTDAQLSGKIWRRSLLAEAGLRFLPGPMSEAAFFLSAAGHRRLASYYPRPAMDAGSGPAGPRWLTEPPRAARLTAAVEMAAAALDSDMPENLVRFHLMIRATDAILETATFADIAARRAFRDQALQKLRDWARPARPLAADADLGEVGRGLLFQLRAEGVLA